MAATISVSGNIRPVMAALKTVSIPAHWHAEGQHSALPFVTISRQAGAGGWTLAQELAAALNIPERNEARRWTSWDRELVEKVADDHQIRIPDDVVDYILTTTSREVGALISAFHQVYRFSMAEKRRITLPLAREVRELTLTGRML